MPLPPLPHRHAQLGVVYPVGTFRGVFWWEELALLNNVGGRVLNTHKILYASTETCSCALVAQHLLDLRYEGNIFAKRILNSIYGRLAFSPVLTKMQFFLLGPNQPDLGPATQVTLWRDLVILEVPTKSTAKPKSNRAVAAIITARARAKLYALMLENEACGDILYVDTDEIFIRPYNWLGFMQARRNWRFYRSVKFFCERNYEASPNLGADYIRGTERSTITTRRRLDLGSGLTAPHRA